MCVCVCLPSVLEERHRREPPDDLPPAPRVYRLNQPISPGSSLSSLIHSQHKLVAKADPCRIDICKHAAFVLPCLERRMGWCSVNHIRSSKPVGGVLTKTVLSMVSGRRVRPTNALIVLYVYTHCFNWPISLYLLFALSLVVFII